jgi:hypothetical protein
MPIPIILRYSFSIKLFLLLMKKSEILFSLMKFSTMNPKTRKLFSTDITSITDLTIVITILKTVLITKN